MSKTKNEKPLMELITGSCIGFYKEDCKECISCREIDTCKRITESEDLSKEFGKIKKDDRKNINYILKEIKGGQLF